MNKLSMSGGQGWPSDIKCIGLWYDVLGLRVDT